MKQDLQQLVDQWTHQSVMFEVRTITVQDSPVVFGELLLTLRIEMAVTYASHSKLVRCSKLYHTYENQTNAEKSTGDCYRFSRQANSLDNEFGDAYEHTLSQLLKQQHGEGFVNIDEHAE